MCVLYSIYYILWNKQHEKYNKNINHVKKKKHMASHKTHTHTHIHSIHLFIQICLKRSEFRFFFVLLPNKFLYENELDKD